MFVELRTISLLAPEITLLAAATCIFVAGAFTRGRAWWATAATVSYLAAALVLASQAWPAHMGSVASGPVVIDPMSLSLRWLAILIGLVFTLIAARLADAELASEYIGCLMVLASGLMIVASANELVLLFLGLELVSIPTYVLLFLARRDRASAEATMKYFYLSILSSALLLYGFSFLYGLGQTTLLAGSESHPGVREALASPAALRGSPLAPLLPLALVLIVAGLGFRLTIAPLQFYAPDVYQGTTNANAGLLAVAPKVAGIAAAVRILVVAMPAAADFAWQLALVLAALTMTIGNVCALWQRNIRRLMAYSSIAHGGYLLVGLASAAAANAALPGTFRGGTTAMIFYVIVYALATMTAFAAFAFLGSSRREVNNVEELSGLARSHPATAAAIAVAMFSLAGLPPLAGFWGKFNLLGAAIQIAMAPAGSQSLWFAGLATITAINAAIAAAYYLRIVAVMYFQPATEPVAAQGGPAARFAALACALLTVAIGALPGRLLGLATESETVLRPANRSVSAPLGAPVLSLDDQLPRTR